MAGWIERQDLPPALSGGLELVEEFARFFAEASDAVRAGQACRMEKDSGRTWDFHSVQYLLQGRFGNRVIEQTTSFTGQD